MRMKQVGWFLHRPCNKVELCVKAEASEEGGHHIPFLLLLRNNRTKRNVNLHHRQNPSNHYHLSFFARSLSLSNSSLIFLSLPSAMGWPAYRVGPFWAEFIGFWLVNKLGLWFEVRPVIWHVNNMLKILKFY